jgi:hypothetical protein
MFLSPVLPLATAGAITFPKEVLVDLMNRKARTLYVYTRSAGHKGVWANHRPQQSGTEFARTKENVAEIMRAKQAAGKLSFSLFEPLRTRMGYAKVVRMRR